MLGKTHGEGHDLLLLATPGSGGDSDGGGSVQTMQTAWVSHPSGCSPLWRGVPRGPHYGARPHSTTSANTAEINREKRLPEDRGVTRYFSDDSLFFVCFGGVC